MISSFWRRIASGPLARIGAASSSTAAVNPSSGTTRLTRPHWSACAAVTGAPVSNISAARPGPIIGGGSAPLVTARAPTRPPGRPQGAPPAAPPRTQGRAHPQPAPRHRPLPAGSTRKGARVTPGDGGAADALVAVDDDLVGGVQLVRPELDLLDGDVHGVGELAEARLPVLPHVEQERSVVAIQTLLQLLRCDLVHGGSATGAPGARPESPRASRSRPRRARSAGSARTRRPSGPSRARAFRRPAHSARARRSDPGGRGSAAPADRGCGARGSSPA